ncbi:hypothetical protein EXM22_08420 [Oceanispirochaeta crateris]|uniref:Uncharacterized protein n=1 Tax=Oceanispirochaeta crateris TaxID=2518645 RepID=A0A5C1QN61_9SPIO|nr:ankyrin repeat domain-containing protein [Oceanispirochaeta crateris]QEN08006.1 hypothetical protein EXM22_08420 [Oceanispirochaeta crateris]
MKMIKSIPFFVIIISYLFFTPFLFADRSHEELIIEVLEEELNDLEAPGDIDIPDDRGRTALMRAVWQERTDLVRRLLSSGADPNLKDMNGQTALYFALQFTHDNDILSLLLRAGARTDLVDNSGKTPIEVFISRGQNPDFIDVFKEYGLFPSEERGEESLLFTVLDRPDSLLKYQFLEALSNAGCSLEGRNSLNRTPEEEALAQDDLKSADFLATLRYSLNEAMIDALEYHGQELTEFEILDFLNRGASPSYKNAGGYTPCHYAVAAGRPDLLNLLLQWDTAVFPFKNDPRELQNLILFFPLDYEPMIAVPLMELLLDQGLPVNIRDEKGQTLLAKSILHSTPLASLLIERGADPNLPGPEGVSPLMTALTIHLEDDVTLLEELAAAGADLGARDSQGWSALTYAILYGQNTKVMETLITLGVDPEIRDDFGTPGFFWAAAYADDTGFVASLLKDKAKAGWRDKDGWTPLMGALRFGNTPEMVALLAEMTPDGRIRDGIGRTLEEFKSEYEKNSPYQAPVELDRLIKNKRVYPADSIPVGGDLNKALLEVIRWGKDPAIAELLISEGADPNASDEEGFTALMTASAYSSYDMVRTLIRRGASVFDITPSGWTAFHLAAWSSDSRISSLLMEEGWDVDVRDFDNWTALMWVMRNHGSPEHIQLLLDAGADAEARSYRNETVLHLACSAWVAPHLESLDLLIEAGTDVNGLNIKGETPLILAASMGYGEVCQFLLEKGADPSILDKDGDSAYSRAYNKGYFELAELLGQWN